MNNIQIDLKYIFSSYDYLVYGLCKIQLLVYYQCRVLIGWATTRLYVIAP